jgi:hypothetical protein
MADESVHRRSTVARSDGPPEGREGGGRFAHGWCRVAAIALGAILTFAVEVQNPDGININTIGVILMIVGVIGLIVSAAVLSGRRRDVVVERRDVI